METTSASLAIALVGNGPLSQEQVSQIEEYVIVYRCNHMPAWKEGQKVTHVLLGDSPVDNPLESKLEQGGVEFRRHWYAEKVIQNGLSEEQIARKLMVETYLQPLSPRDSGSVKDSEKEPWIFRDLVGMNGIFAMLLEYPTSVISIFGFDFYRSVRSQYRLDLKDEEEIMALARAGLVKYEKPPASPDGISRRSRKRKREDDAADGE